MNERRLFLLIFLILSPSIKVKAQDYSSNSLIIDVFPDGSVNIDYSIKPDPTFVRVNVTLPGENYEDLIAVDQDGIILNWDLNRDGIEVDSIGANELIISYSSSFFTNKTGSTWTVSADSPVSASYQLPKGAVLVGLSTTPSSVSIVDDRAVITMSPGPNSITYILGATGTQEHALVLLSQAETKIEEANTYEIQLTSVENLYTQAKQAYETGSYTQAEQLSQRIITQVTDIIEEADQALTQITNAEELFEHKIGVLNPETIESAQTNLDEAIQEYDSGDYTSAYTLALETIQLLQEPEPKTDPRLLYGVTIMSIFGISGFLLYQKQLKTENSPKRDEKKPNVDLEKVFKNKNHLRTDEKAVLRFIEESNGAFITEVRERFDIPKSSAWRMVKRLSEEGVITVSQVGRETYLQLRNPEGMW